ncbi:hypothetical protein PTKU46_01420 [Paraburkholderia terrae]|uniref:hypothetical protein n=1 Tax=Paraburkholderia terrae TaxID=311230 RepID=UPI0030E42B01
MNVQITLDSGRDMRTKLPGVYEIVHIKSGRTYIGSAADMVKRVAYHRWALRYCRHHNRFLQRSWDKYGELAFGFRPLFVCPVADLLFFEQRAIDVLAPEFNVLPVAGGVRGHKWTAEQRARHCLAMRNKPVPPAQGRAVSEAWRRGVYKEGMRAKSNLYAHAGRTYTIAEAAAEFGINANTLKYRLAKGMPFNDAISAPLVFGGRFAKWLYQGEYHTMEEVAALCGIKGATIIGRMSRGMSFEEAVTLPLQRGRKRMT